ncbi:MAG: DNA-directed RNA polymerase subunit delta [Selenomonadaceae bacterium]|nr:DNA-directed RNA polymerase subunit delta [Selenomonadaceae bacterium]MBP3722210.1 DNA-directed RNA polymerase subunit delta [Selenomonadaceae bacterium]
MAKNTDVKIKKNPVDEVYDVLKEKGVGVYYKDLIMKVIDNLNLPVRSMSAAISEIYTQMNMDSRFHYAGDGVWDLVEWMPPEVKRRTRVSSGENGSASKASRRKETLFESIQE